MINNNTANEIINILLHIFILFSFLTLFFFNYMSLQEKKRINEEINKLIDSETETGLKYIDDWDKQSGGHINWDNIYKIADDMEQKYKLESPEIKKIDNNLMKGSIILIIIIFIIFIITSLYFIYNKYNIDFEKIFIENFIIFTIAGIIEITFFKHIASKYIPVDASFVSNSIIDRIKYHINK